MLKQYNVRLPIKDIKAIDNLGGCRSEHIRIAIRGYLQIDTNNNGSGYNVDLVNVLKDQVLDLKNDKKILQDRLDYFMLPSYKRFFLKKP